jgi:hypothetical protein
LIKLSFGRKLFGEMFSLKFWLNCHLKATDANFSDFLNNYHNYNFTLGYLKFCP